MNPFPSLLIACALNLAGVTIALAQTYPSKPVRLIIPFAAGGGVDAVGRTIAQKLGEGLGQSVVVENRAGAGGSIATEAVARAAADGYTLLLTTHGHAIQPSLQKTPWDPVRDFAPVMQVLNFAFLVTVHPSVPAKTMKEFIQFAKDNPGKLSYGSSGSGGPIHFAVEILKSIAGIDIVHVPYKGNGPMTAALIAGEIQMSMDSMAVSLPQVRAGKLRGLAVSGSRRWPLAADIPTVSEAALPGYEELGWHGVLTPAATPREIVVKLNRELTRASTLPDVRERLLGLGYEPTSNSPDAFAEKIRTDLAKYARIVKEAGIRGE
ncbi:MAG: tripartite tricarboxylate transporter substrate binding protein [Betaproteobacteria bacterium]|nr:tripartite tricarboxylate transporter substrate binding protein [Betaproteobacteria bacterium]